MNMQFTVPGSRFRVLVQVRVLVLCSVFALFVVPASFAEVTRLEIGSRADIAFAGYEQIKGRLFFAVDPADPRNAVIADLATAPKNAQGKVEFSADVLILRPKSGGNGAAIVDIPNRGGLRVVPQFNRSRGDDVVGDGFLFERGFTVVVVGWQFDVPDNGTLLRIQVPGNPPVAGLGFAAVRDAASWIKYTPGAVTSAKYLYSFGQSQSGRYLRDFVYHGFNSDERGRQVFDGVMPHIAGAARIDLNRRGAQPNPADSVATAFPFADRAMRDPVSGVSEGLLENSRASRNQPKVFYTNSDVEYWSANGRAAALVHTTPDGTRDLELPANVRFYHLAGTQHTPGAFPPGRGAGQQMGNPTDYGYVLRALLVAMDRWVRDGVAPPASRHSRLSDGTLVRVPDAAFPAIPGVQSPKTLHAAARLANPLIAGGAGAGTTLPYLVPQVDADGNPRGGIRVPEIAVPLATYTGWNYGTGENSTRLVNLLGSYIPFARTKAERDQRGDPRASIQERYPSRDAYVSKIRTAADALVRDGYMLRTDVDAVVQRAAAHWDLFAAPATTSAAAQQGTERITHEALWLMPRVGAPALSPDGRWVVFSVVQPAYDEREQSSDLWVVPTDGSAQPRKLTSTRAVESGIAWSPDSRRIAFLSRREGDEVNQIYVLDLAGGEATRVTTISTGASTPVWRPDGNALLFTSLVFPGAADDEANKREAAARRERKYNVRTFDSFPVRMWDRWLDDRRPHVFVQSLEPGAKAVDLLAASRLVQNAGFGGRLNDEGDQLDATWAPDGQSIVFIATTQRTESARATVHEHLYQVPASGGEPRQLTSDARSYARPTFSRDGRTLFVSVADDHDQIYALDRIAKAVWPWTGGAPAVMDAAFDRSASGFVVGADGQVYLTAEDSGLEKLFVVPATGRAQVAVTPERGVYTNVRTAASSPVIVGNWGSATQPSEIVRIDPATKQHTLLTHFTTARAAQLSWLPLRHFTFTSSRGKTIHNLVALPHGFDQSRKYPLLVLIHGGAANMWRDQITLRWNYHLLADPGYVVLMTNYTGSTGFGEKFARDIRLDPFAGPASEINEAADEAIRRFAFIDGTRQIAAGASYGGHLINWLQATTTRYRALVGHAGLVNSEVQWGTSDVVYGRELMNGGPPWEQAKTWIAQNPIRHAAKFKTPILLSVGERDYRVPLNNTLENWSALQRMKVPSRLLVWPDENHWISNGENSRYFYGEVRDWFARWLSATPTATQ